MPKRIIVLVMAITICLATIPAAASAGKERGVLHYEQIITPQYEDAKLFSESLAAVKQDGKWGYIDTNNNVVISFEYDTANSFSEGYAIVGNYSTITGWDDEPQDIVYLGIIDKNGSYSPLRSYTYDWATEQYGVRDHYMYVEYYDENFDYTFYGGWVHVGGLFNTKGSQFTTYDTEYNEIYPAHVPTEGLVPVSDSGMATYYLDLDGEIALDLSNRTAYYDADWEQVDNWEDARYLKYISNILPFNQGIAIVWECTIDKGFLNDSYETWEDSYEFGFIDKNGNWVIEPQYDYFYWSDYNKYVIFAESGLACVGQDGKLGAIDKAGNVIIPFQYEELWPFSWGLSVFKQDGKCGYLDTSGNVVIPAQFVAASGFSDGMAAVFDGTNAYIIDRSGSKVEGSDVIDPGSYFVVLAGGNPIVNNPGKYVTIKEDGLYGFGEITYLPPLPDASEMDGWAYNEVVAAIEEELVPVYLQSLYRGNITRLDYSSLVIHAICSMLDTEIDDLVLQRTGRELDNWVAEYRFSDAPDRTVAAAFALGLVTGYEDSTFRPYNLISRQEAAVLLWRAAGVLGMDNMDPPESHFSDRDNVSNWARREVDYVYAIGVMNGVSADEFAPTNSYTRQQSYMTIHRLLKAMTDELG